MHAGTPATPGSRDRRKAETRRRLLDAALGVLEERSFSSLSLREVARQAGVTPTAFYRHFASLDELGLALVEESFERLREVIAGFRTPTGSGLTGRETTDIVLRFVRDHRAHFRFVARERFGGVPVLEREIAGGLRRFAEELAIDLGRMPAMQRWDPADVAVLSDLVVTVIEHAVKESLETRVADPARDARIIARTERQLAMLMVGTRNWWRRSQPLTGGKLAPRTRGGGARR